jgi:hypothetical protein
LKKIILFLLLITSLYADAKVYMGVSGGYLNESVSNDESTSASSETAKFKIGYGQREAYAVEFSIDYIKNETTIFSTTGEDSDKIGMNVELVKSFDWDIYIIPYFKAGFGSGTFDIKSDDGDSINYGSFNLGLGFFVPINEHFDFEVGYDYKYVSYEEISDTQLNSHMNGAYAGFNVRF